MTDQATTLDAADGQIAYRFHARDLHLVMGPAATGASVRFHVFIDGHRPVQHAVTMSTSRATEP